jgi:hypothetical protein
MTYFNVLCRNAPGRTGEKREVRIVIIHRNANVTPRTQRVSSTYHLRSDIRVASYHFTTNPDWPSINSRFI